MTIRFQRNNQTYRMLVSICQLIIEGMLITTDAGDYRLASFVDEQRMCRLYEKFILEYYTRINFSYSLHCQSEHRKYRGRWMMALGPCFRSCKAIFTCSVEIPYLLLMRNTIATLRRSSLINILFIRITCIRFIPTQSLRKIELFGISE